MSSDSTITPAGDNAIPEADFADPFAASMSLQDNRIMHYRGERLDIGAIDL
jgi:hypothetical protein